METTACNYCGSSDADELHIIPDLLLDRKSIHGVYVRCRSCGQIYQNPRPTVEELAGHYPDHYDSFDRDPAGHAQSPPARWGRQQGLNRRAGLITKALSGGRLLDIGCSTGSFLLHMQGINGWEVSGVEINPKAADLARQHGLDVHTGTLESAHFPEASLDAVTMWDVLEHLHDPAATLAEICRILKPGGVLALRTPNLGGWDARLFGQSWYGWDAPRHMFVFDTGSLRRMLKRAGFEKVHVRSRDGGFPAVVLSVRFLLSCRGADSALTRRIAGWLMNPVIRLAAAPLTMLLGLAGPGGPQLTAACIKEAG